MSREFGIFVWVWGVILVIEDVEKHRTLVKIDGTGSIRGPSVSDGVGVCREKAEGGVCKSGDNIM